MTGAKIQTEMSSVIGGAVAEVGAELVSSIAELDKPGIFVVITSNRLGSAAVRVADTAQQAALQAALERLLISNPGTIPGFRTVVMPAAVLKEVPGFETLID